MFVGSIPASIMGGNLEDKLNVNPADRQRGLVSGWHVQCFINYSEVGTCIVG